MIPSLSRQQYLTFTQVMPSMRTSCTKHVFKMRHLPHTFNSSYFSESVNFFLPVPPAPPFIHGSLAFFVAYITINQKFASIDKSLGWL